MKPYVVLEDVTKTFGHGAREVHAVQHVDLTIGEGELVALKGRSGSGKTTLINCIGGLDAATSGRIRLGEHEITAMNEAQILALRRRTIAYVFQSFGLIPVLTVAENVSVPLRLERLAPKEREARVREVLEMVDLAHHAKHLPGQLSGGQQQRVALARALVARPRLLLADEPTGQLDSETGATIMGLIGDLVRETGMTTLIATHDDALMRFADRVVEMRDGRLYAGHAPEEGEVPAARRTGPAAAASAATTRPDAAGRGALAATPAAAVPLAADAGGAATATSVPAAGVREPAASTAARPPRHTRRRWLVPVIGVTALALAAAGTAWALARPTEKADVAGGPATSSAPGRTAPTQRIALVPPETFTKTTYLLPPTKEKALSGAYTSKELVELTVRRGDNGLVLEETTPGGTPKALSAVRGPDGWWTAQTSGGIGLTLQTYTDEVTVWRGVSKAGTAKKPVWLGSGQPQAPGMALDLWSVPMQPEDLHRMFNLLVGSKTFDTHGALITDPHAPGLAGNVTSASVPPPGPTCTAQVMQPGTVTEGNLDLRVILVGEPGKQPDFKIEMNDPALKPFISAFEAPKSGPEGAEGYADLEISVPLSGDYAKVVQDETIPDPRLGVKRITWTDVKGATWVWDTPTLSQRATTVTCPVKQG